MQGKWAHLFFRKGELKIGRNWCKLGKIGWNWRKLKLSIFAICTNFRQFLQFVSIFANFFGGLIGHYLLNRNLRKISESLLNLLNFAKSLAKFWQKNEITELCKGVHCVDLGESFQTHIFLQNLASIQPRTSPPKSPRDK